MPFAWSAVALTSLISNEPSLEREDSTSSLDRKSSIGSADSGFRRLGGLTGRGSLDRSSMDQRRSWSPDDLTSFRPVTITISSFFRQETERLKDEDLFKFLQDLKRPCYLTKKLKALHGRHNSLHNSQKT